MKYALIFQHLFYNKNTKWTHKIASGKRPNTINALRLIMICTLSIQYQVKSYSREVVGWTTPSLKGIGSVIILLSWRTVYFFTYSIYVVIHIHINKFKIANQNISDFFGKKMKPTPHWNLLLALTVITFKIFC